MTHLLKPIDRRLDDLGVDAGTPPHIEPSSIPVRRGLDDEAPVGVEVCAVRLDEDPAVVEAAGLDDELFWVVVPVVGDPVQEAVASHLGSVQRGMGLVMCLGEEEGPPFSPPPRVTLRLPMLTQPETGAPFNHRSSPTPQVQSHA